jgi:ABC-type Co2+ transport system permease subunit
VILFGPYLAAASTAFWLFVGVGVLTAIGLAILGINALVDWRAKRMNSGDF